MKNHIKVFFTLSFSLLLWTLQAQIMNIERRRQQFDTIGWFGSTEWQLIAEQNSKRYFTFRTLNTIERQTYKRNFLILSELRFVSGEGQTFANSGFIHFRYTYKVDEIPLDSVRRLETGHFLRWESFIQQQYNALLGVRFRNLLGTGLRFKIVQKRVLSFFTGITPVMHEYEIERNGKINNDLRLNTYAAVNYRADNNVTLVMAVYYQPMWFKAYDHRISWESNVFTKLTRKFDLTINLNYLYDTNPPEGIRNHVYNILNGVRYNF